MGYFDKWAEDRFDDLPDGSAVFYPKGRDGPGYLIPDRHTRTRLEWSYKAVGIAGAAASMLLAHVIRSSGDWQWLLSLLLFPALNWVVGERGSEGLVRVHEPVLAIEQRDHRPSEGSGRSLWLILAASAAGSVVAFVTFVQRGPDGLGILALIAAVLLAVPVPLALQELQRLRELSRRRDEIFPRRSRLILR